MPVININKRLAIILIRKPTFVSWKAKRWLPKKANWIIKLKKWALLKALVSMPQHWNSIKKGTWYLDRTNELKLCIDSLERANL